MGIQSNILLGTVLDTADPDGLGRVQVSLHGFSTAFTSPWLQVIQPFVGPSYGVHFLPDAGTTVAVLRGFGNAAEGLIVLGALYNSHTDTPYVTDATDNAIKEIRTTSGHSLTFDDTADAEKISIISSDEKLKIEIDVANGKVAITGDKEINLTSTEKLIVSCAEMEITGSTSVTIKDSPTVTIDGADDVSITGSSSVTIDGGGSLTLTASAIEMK